ncbi:MAG: hypothetical protein A2086_09270 [Spirochaetes bacterium GWD1_27_9]|nr:MAG: hypothetical protein A2Z98_02440 [Spirochaetes bacterium GWB1_27_13]OHD25509.1 MAG: hypothetical protein A2Y34_09960 [Spirochaetes bacterium GWC1_27_15]OHD30991.1 MAG: hypothetical protein A2086_09270 [Spirochaetes bacterium GWD1_27_9]
MKKLKILFINIFLITNLFVFAETDFENNFLQTYLNVENFFLKIGGDYGTTFFPFLNTGYGGRQVGFSGAFTAVADDISTLESNPAGTASLNFTELFFSHNKLMGDVNYNTIAYTMRFNNLGLGIGTRMLYIPFTHYDKFGIDVGSGIINYTVITLNGSYNFLKSYDFFGLSVGGNIKLYIYGVPDSIALNQSRVNVAFDIGILTKFNFLKAYKKNEKNFSIGLALKNIGPFTDGEPPPTKISVGLAYKPIEQLLMSVDLDYLINYSELTYKNWSVSSGMEWYFTKYSSLILGFVVKSNPSFSLGFNLNFDDFTISAIYNPDFVDLARFSISASLKLGDLGRGKNELIIKKMYSVALHLMNSGNYQEAKEILEKIIEKEPNFSPAKKSLKNVQRQLDIQDNLNEVIKSQRELTY